MEKLLKSVFNSFFFCQSLSMHRRLYNAMWPKIAITVQTVFSVYIYIIHYTYYMPSDTNQRWSLVPLVECCCFFSFVWICIKSCFLFMTYICCDHSFGHASRIAQIAHFVSIIFEFVWFTFRIKILEQITWQMWNKTQSTIVCLLVCVWILSAWMKIKWANEWMNECKIDRETKRKRMNPLKCYIQTKFANDS